MLTVVAGYWVWKNRFSFSRYIEPRGIHDLMYLDLLPKLNIYRLDPVPSDLSMAVIAIVFNLYHLDTAMRKIRALR